MLPFNFRFHPGYASRNDTLLHPQSNQSNVGGSSWNYLPVLLSQRIIICRYVLFFFKCGTTLSLATKKGCAHMQEVGPPKDKPCPSRKIICSGTIEVTVLKTILDRPNLQGHRWHCRRKSYGVGKISIVCEHRMMHHQQILISLLPHKPWFKHAGVLNGHLLI